MNLKVLGLFGIIILIVAVVIFGSNNNSDNENKNPIPIETNDTSNNDDKNSSSVTEVKDTSQSSKSEKPSAEPFEVHEITSTMSGLTREVRGIVTILNEGKGNIFFTLKDVNSNAKIKAVMFAKTNHDYPERLQMLLNSRDTNSVIYVKGEIDIYKDELEIKVWQVYTK